MALTQQEADNLANIQSQLIQVNSTLQHLTMLTNSLSTGRVNILTNLKTVQRNINDINKDVSRQLSTQKIR
jgi:K+/H+ antiporter YhaU regulatory subunit KhtT